MGEYSKTLYSRDKKGNLTHWTIEVIQLYDHRAKMNISYGRVGTHNNPRSYIYTEGKNVGKSNETTPFEQGVLEAKSKVSKKINSGYRDVSLEDAEREIGFIKLDKNNIPKPMLAKPYVSGKYSFPRIAQRKYNGVRAELGFRTVSDGLFGDKTDVYLLSREGKEYPVPTHIKEYMLAKLYEHPLLEYVVFDGEIYNHSMLLQQIASAIKKPNVDTPKLYFVAYDIKNDEIQVDRIKRLERLMNIHLYGSRAILYAPSITVYDEATAYELADSFIDEGYEGAILRDIEAKYYNGRSNNLLKIKKVYSAEFPLHNIVDSGRDLYKGLPIAKFVCINKSTGKTFNVTPQGSKEYRYNLYLNKDEYIGKPITVEYRELSKDKVPIHATGIIRDYE